MKCQIQFCGKILENISADFSLPIMQSVNCIKMKLDFSAGEFCK